MMEEMLISMLQKMTGLSPEQMQGLTEKAMAMLESFTNDMSEIKTALERIETTLAAHNGTVIEGKVIEHVESNG
jgi:hypothetical protein